MIFHFITVTNKTKKATSQPLLLPFSLFDKYFSNVKKKRMLESGESSLFLDKTENKRKTLDDDLPEYLNQSNDFFASDDEHSDTESIQSSILSVLKRVMNM